MTFLLISLFLLVFYAVLIIYYRQSWLQLKSYPPVAGKSIKHSTFVTVVIAARNEEKNIGSCIESIIKQTYPDNLFELIIVDDNSNDSTAIIAHSFDKTNISVISLKDFSGNENLNSYKKKAVETAIGLATGSLIVTTDADCVVHEEWLQTIASYYEEFGPAFIAAPVVYTNPLPGDSHFKKFLKIFQSLDFIMLQGITGASVYKKFHSMCNGANLAYEKKAFKEAGGFEGIDNIASGDDILLMHKIQKIYPDKIMYLKSANVVVQTQPSETLKDFMNQRIRWASKADKYPDRKITAVLMLVYVFNAWIFFMALCSFFYLDAFYSFLVLFIMKTIVELFFLFPVAGFFRKQKLLWLFLPAQPFHIMYTLIAGWLGKFGSYRWKGRKIK
jgi:cellulose synthase/poly-beta-1,6-N-acetylglucosamine synthase-like glycosyltransferase